MSLFTKLLALVKPKPAPALPPPPVPDTEFLEAVAKTWRERYQSQPPTPFTTNQPGQAA